MVAQKRRQRLACHGRDVAQVHGERLVAEVPRAGGLAAKVHALDQQIHGRQHARAGGHVAHRGVVIWSIALPMAAANAVGAATGAHLAIRNGDRLVRAVVLVVVAAIIIKLALDLARS